MKRKIKAFFKKHPSLKIKPKKLAEQLFIKQTYEYAKLKEVLHVLVAESFLTKVGKRYQLYIPTPKNIVGRIMISRDGSYGFVSSNNHSFNDIFIPGKYLNTAFSGDIVQVDLLAKKKGKNIEGAITKVIERRRKELIGTLHKTKSFYFVLPDEKDIHRDIYIAASNLNNAKNNDKVVVGNIEWNSHLLNPEGKITEILGKAGTYETEIAAIAREFNISYKFPAKVLKEAKGISEKISPSEYKKRLDLRSENVFTIDPEDAKDFDDAVSVKVLNNGNFLVGIHIADVSYYLKEDSLIFKEASKRGTSVYLVNNVIPMLPEKLSNDVCSLVPQKDRLTYSVFVELTGRMKIVKYQIKKSIIRSKKRFTYSEAQKILDNKRGEFYNELSTLNKIAVSLRKKRMRKGSINFIRPEIEFKLDDKGVPLNIQIKKLEPTNNLIEELMLLANQIVASHPSLNNSRIDFPFIYRIHDLPDKEKLFEFAKFVKTLGYNFNPDAAKNSKELQKLLEAVQGQEEEALINEIAIRSMAKAVYSADNIGHYALGFKYYTHFTSPIRRFPDVIVHKLIFDYIEKKHKPRFSKNSLEEIAQISSEQEKNAVQAERLSIKFKQMEYLKNRLGDNFHGVISGITNFGMFIQLSENLAMGLVRLSDMEDDYYVLDEKNYVLTGRLTGKKYRLGDKVKVKLIRIDKEQRGMDFSLL